ncbi:MAG: C4-type zinc ribbon domain-containing protein [Christensenellales bacterium]|nr:C4-type zinc ribbon domain-containing protein [Christensenellales bacterium]
MQLDVLWQFMQVDMEADRFESKMRQSEKRQTLIKQRNLLLELQTNMKKLENDVSVMQDRLEAIRDEAMRLEANLNAQIAIIDASAPKTAEEADKSAETIKKLMDTLVRYEQELQKMRKDAEIKDRQQKEIRVRAAKTKAEYDQLKIQYDAEFKKCSVQLQEMRDHIEEESRKVNGDLLARYRTIKQHSSPPMAKLIDDRCSGCFMQPSSATLLELRNGNRIVECDNCGRILYLKV